MFIKSINVKIIQGKVNLQITTDKGSHVTNGFINFKTCQEVWISITETNSGSKYLQHTSCLPSQLRGEETTLLLGCKKGPLIAIRGGKFLPLSEGCSFTFNMVRNELEMSIKKPTKKKLRFAPTKLNRVKEIPIEGKGKHKRSRRACVKCGQVGQVLDHNLICRLHK